MSLWHFCIIAFVLTLLPNFSNTCSSNGICGLQPNCYGSYPGYGSYGNGIGGGSGGGGGCGGGCGSGYGCGQYGCHRQCGSKTFQPEKERRRKMQAAKLLAIKRGEIPQKSISEIENLEYASETAALIKRFPTARLVSF
uniref:Chorion class high-cysteine HCB protein 13 n=1 Tax=Panagrolaimus davidi TaxID=227884 RepID=A0A914PQL9_9BILA